MFQNSQAYSSMSVHDSAAAKDFYGDVLGLKVTDEDVAGFQMVTLHLATGGRVLLYPKENHEPATYTALYFPVDDIDKTVDELIEKGITLERYEGMHQDEKGITRGLANNMGPDVAWFKDPSGNILSVTQEQ